MRIVLHNEFYGQQTAEGELCRRIAIAARHLGWEASEVQTSEEIISLRPDFVLALHFRTPKLTEFPTYGCLWNPPSIIERDPQFLRSVRSYDGYLTSCEASSDWVRRLLAASTKRAFIAPIYTSCPRRPWQNPTFELARLAYLGTNWDGARHGQLLHELADRPYFDIYGPAGRWAHAAVAYRGPLPFDGETVLDVLNRSGVALCLHAPEHREAGIPSSRIFEIAASGAVAICEEHSFIRQTFGERVLYLEDGLSPAQTAEQVAERFEWVRAHSEQASAMSRQAHAIFDRELSLEPILEGIARAHREHVDRSVRAIEVLRRTSPGEVDVVVRTGMRPPHFLARALSSIAAQTYSRVRVLIVKCGPQDITPALAYLQGREFEVIAIPPESHRSTALWTGLRAARGAFVANLDDDDRWFPDHLAVLVSLIADTSAAALAYSGSVRRQERDSVLAPAPPREPAALTYHDPFDRDRLYSLQNYITSNSWVARRELVNAAGEDPGLDVWEDLLLLVRFAEASEFVFSGEVTAEYFHRTSLTDNAVFDPGWPAALSKVRELTGLADPADNAGVENERRCSPDWAALSVRLQDQQ